MILILLLCFLIFISNAKRRLIKAQTNKVSSYKESKYFNYFSLFLWFSSFFHSFVKNNWKYHNLQNNKQTNIIRLIISQIIWSCFHKFYYFYSKQKNRKISWIFSLDKLLYWITIIIFLINNERDFAQKNSKLC